MENNKLFELNDETLGQVSGGTDSMVCMECQRCGLAFYGRTARDACSELRIHMNHEHGEDFNA